MAHCSKIKILVLLPTSAYGGAERFLYNLLSRINRARFRIVLVTSEKVLEHFSGLLLERVVAIEDIGIDVSCREASPGNIAKFWADVKAIAVLVGKESPDIVCGINYGSFLLSIAKELHRLAPRVISAIKGPFRQSIDLMFDGRERDILFWNRIFSLMCRYSNLLVVPSEGMKRDFVKSYKISENMVRVIPEGIDINYIKTLAIEPVDCLFPGDYPIITTAARLSLEKNPALLLSAFALLKKSLRAKLVIIGDGHLMPYLKELSNALDIDGDVIFAGFRENPFSIISRSDIYVHTCLYEGFGLSLLEAMACGIPVIANDCPYGPREIIKDGESGILTPIGRPKALAEAMEALLNDKERRADISEKASMRSMDFPIDKMVRDYEEVIFTG